MRASSTGSEKARPPVTPIGHWVGGASGSGSSGRTAPVYDPALGVQTSEVALASAAEVDHAVKTAVTASREWGASSLTRRTGFLFRLRELLDAHPDVLGAAVTR